MQRQVIGTWTYGTVNGQLRIVGWESAQGLPGLTPDAEGAAVPVSLLVSDALPAQLVRIAVQLDGATVEAWIYAVAE